MSVIFMIIHKCPMRNERKTLYIYNISSTEWKAHDLYQKKNIIYIIYNNNRH